MPFRSNSQLWGHYAGKSIIGVPRHLLPGRYKRHVSVHDRSFGVPRLLIEQVKFFVFAFIRRVAAATHVFFSINRGG
jgi:hypothetical protein